MYLSAFVDFEDIFVRYSSKQSKSEWSLMVTEMVSTTVFSPKKKSFSRNKSLNKFGRCLYKNYALHTSQIRYRFLFMLYFFLIGIHSMQGWTATTRHGVKRKRSTKRLKHTGNLFRRNLQLIGVCQFYT